MPAVQVQELCVYQDESVTILLEVFDENDELLDLTGARVLTVVWDPATDITSFTKDSDIGPAEVLIDPDQVANTGQARIFIVPTDLAPVAVLKHNVWVDIGADQHLVVRPSRFEILDSKRV